MLSYKRIALIDRLAEVAKSDTLGKVYWNSGVSIATSVFQNLCASLFFIVAARHYGPFILADFVLANSLYQLIAVIAPFGIAHFFIREYTRDVNLRSQLTRDSFVLELVLGLLGYVVVVLAATILGYGRATQVLAMVLGINVIFDNLLVSLRSIFVAESKQFYMSVATALESILKLCAALCLLLFDLTLGEVSLLIVSLRCISLVVAIQFLAPDRIHDMKLAFTPIRMCCGQQIRRVIDLMGRARNFAVINTVAMIYWQLNTLVLGKVAAPQEISFYNVGTKMFAVFQILPVYYLQALFPVLSEAHKNDKSRFVELANSALAHMGLFSFSIAFPLAYCAGDIINLLFGPQYGGASGMTGTLVITLIPFSLGLVQAYVLLASMNEKIDMWLNVMSLGVNACLAILLTARYGGNGAALAIMCSFTIFFIAQQIVLNRRGLKIWEGLPFKFTALAIIHIMLLTAGGRIHTLIGVSLGQLGFWSLASYWKLLDVVNIVRRLRTWVGEPRVSCQSRSIQRVL